MMQEEPSRAKRRTYSALIRSFTTFRKVPFVLANLTAYPPDRLAAYSTPHHARVTSNVTPMFPVWNDRPASIRIRS